MQQQRQTLSSHPFADMVRSTLSGSPARILALHVEPEQRGAGRTVCEAFRQSGVDVQTLNQATEREDLVASLGRHDDPAAALPRIFEGSAIRVVYLTGWGTDPRSADALLRAVYTHVAARSNLRLVAMNNASPVPHMFVQSEPVAHLDPDAFAHHVAGLARIGRDMVDLHAIRRHDLR